MEKEWLKYHPDVLKGTKKKWQVGFCASRKKVISFPEVFKSFQMTWNHKGSKEVWLHIHQQGAHLRRCHQLAALWIWSTWYGGQQMKAQ